jgi:hypothetical protein
VEGKTTFRSAKAAGFPAAFCFQARRTASVREINFLCPPVLFSRNSLSQRLNMMAL